MKCDRCGVESEREGFFRVVARSFSKGTLRLCPSCAAKHREKEQMQAIWITVGMWGFLFLLSWLTPEAKLGPFCWNLGLFLVFLFGSTVVHELGHVVAGRLAGMHITGIEIGMGPLVLDFRCLGFRWQFRAVPVGGLAFGVPRDGTWVRLRQTAYILGGPLANLFVIGVVLALAGTAEAPRFDFLERFSPGTTLLFASAALFVGSLVPMMLDTSHGMLPSDGLLLWRVWRLSREEIEAATPYWYAVHCQDLLHQGKGAEAIIIFQEGLWEHPDDPSLDQVRALTLLSEGRAAEARQIYTKILGRYSRFEHLRYTMFNNIAWADVLMGDPNLLWEANAGSRLALEAQPHCAPFKGTRGAVLVELGELDDGLRHLQEAMRENEDDGNKAANACFIGIAHARRGDAEQCHSYFALARRLDPKCVLLEREPKLAGSGPGPS